MADPAFRSIYLPLSPPQPQSHPFPSLRIPTSEAYSAQTPHPILSLIRREFSSWLIQEKLASSNPRLSWIPSLLLQKPFQPTSCQFPTKFPASAVLNFLSYFTEALWHDFLQQQPSQTQNFSSIILHLSSNTTPQMRPGTNLDGCPCPSTVPFPGISLPQFNHPKRKNDLLHSEIQWDRYNETF